MTLYETAVGHEVPGRLEVGPAAAELLRDSATWPTGESAHAAAHRRISWQLGSIGAVEIENGSVGGTGLEPVTPSV